MKFAQHVDEMIFLNEDAYSRIPVWRLWAEKGKLRCPACQAPLQLIAGVSFEPFFQHPAENICALQGDEQPPQEFLSYGLAEAAAATEARGGGQQKGTAATTGDGIIPQGTAADGGHGEMRQGDDITTIGSFRLPKKRQIGNSQPSSPVQPPVYTFRKRLTPKHTIQHLAESYSEPLHPQQQRAVRTTEGPLLILAGAGSGKTRVMTARTAYLIQAAGVQPRSIMVVTFTNKAADEMKHRLAQQLTAQQARELITGTFHSIFYRMLQHHQPDRWAQDRLLKQEWQKRRLLRETGALQQEPELAALKESEVEAALAIVSRWKNEFVLPKQLAMLEFPTEEEKQARLLYPLYEKTKRSHGWFDFDDMLLGCYTMLRENPDILRRYQERIQHLMIDEFQDINRIQYETVKLLAAPQNNLCVIGDDDQSIYGFRGSDPQYILGFTKDYPDAAALTLEVNYRSRSSIVGLGYSLIGNNRARWKKEFISFHSEEGENYLFHPEDEEEQAARIVDEIRFQQKRGATMDQFAILFRTYESTRPVVERLMETGLRFHFVQEEESFYEKQVVRWALSYLRLSLDRDNAAALREILPTLYISREQWNTLRSQAILDDVPLLDVLPNLPHWKVYQRNHLQRVVEIVSELRYCRPAQALELVYEDCKLRDYVKKRMKERTDSTIDRWSDDLQQLIPMAKRHDTLIDFFDHISKMTAKEKERRSLKPQSSEAIQVLSIHRAKGLEFDTVFLLDLVEGALPHEYALDELRKRGREALEEERRLLYVAITRARRTLCIGIPQERFGRKTKVSRFIAEMEG